MYRKTNTAVHILVAYTLNIDVELSWLDETLNYHKICYYINAFSVNKNSIFYFFFLKKNSDVIVVFENELL